MVAAQHAVPEVLKYLLDQAEAVKPGTLMSASQEPLLLRYVQATSYYAAPPPFYM